VSPQVLSALGTEVQQFRAAAQCVAYLAAAELQQNSWPELIPTLLGNVTTPQSTEQLKEASLDAVGYICEDLVGAYALC
jgi:importin subunit beta-1